jgi:hypothetical protein
MVQSSPKSERFICSAPTAGDLILISGAAPVGQDIQTMSRWVWFSAILNRTQLLVVSFFVLVWIGLVAILVLSPEVYAQALRKVGGATLAIEASFLIAGRDRHVRWLPESWHLGRVLIQR